MLKELKDGRIVNVEKAVNGKSFVTVNSVKPVFHAVIGNSKTGEEVGNYNLPIEYTCDHRCECYKEGLCYAENGCYQFTANQASYTENYLFYRVSTINTIANSITEFIHENGFSLFRYFTCGDIPSEKFLRIMIKVAIDNPSVKFLTYTKKYSIVNKFVDENGLDAIPENLTIVFSHWLNRDGTYFPMDNKYNFPTSEFIPYGKEELKNSVTHVCPCSDPTVKATCATCDHPCYKLRHGESMALLEHSTKETKQRDKEIREAHEKL